MPAFKVKKTYYFGKHDLIVLTGTVAEPPVEPGMWIDLPKAMKGPGRVPITGVQFIEFATGSQLSVLIPYSEVQASSLEFSLLEGMTLEVFG